MTTSQWDFRLPQVSNFFLFSIQDGMTVTSNYLHLHDDKTTISAMEIADADKLELVEAVAGLKITRPPLPLKTPLVEGATVDPGRVDSGYASANSSQRSSPDSSKTSFINGGTAVSKALTSWGIPTRKKIKLMPFDKPIPMLTQLRFDNLRELHADGLNKLSKGLLRCRGILMSLKVLGESETTAVPWVFIQCEKAIAGKVRRFFKQPAVQSDFKPPHPDTYTPRLEIYVLELPPLALHNSSPSEGDRKSREKTALYFQKSKTLSSESLCGSTVSVDANGEMRSATVGGLISVRSKFGENFVFGMTAGHFLAEEHYTTQEIEVEGEEEEEEEEGEEDIDDFSDLADNDVFELDMSSFSTEVTNPSEQDDMKIESPHKPQTVIGHVYGASQDDLGDRPNLDWVLFTVDDTSLHLPNIVNGREIHSQELEITDNERRVVLDTATSGSVFGVLSNSWSYLMLAPGNSLVRTHALTISDGLVLRPGDSGAWVVDAGESTIYGHVVASDVFGVSYVVPIDDIFQDIRLRLSLDAVSLNQVPPKPVYVPEVKTTKPESKELKRKPVAVAVAVANSRNRTADHFSEYHLLGATLDNTSSTATAMEPLPSSNYLYTDGPLSDLPDDPKNLYPNHSSPANYIHSSRIFDPSIFNPPNTSPKQEGYPDSGYSTMENSPNPSPQPSYGSKDATTTYYTPSTYPPPEPYPAPPLSPKRIPSYPQIVSDEPSKAAPPVGTHTPDSSGKSRVERIKARLGLSKKES